MKTEHPFSLSSRLKSFGYALNGWRILIKSEPNALIHLIAAIAVIVLGLFFKINLTEWAIIIICIASVIGAELFNSALEVLCDYVQPDKHQSIKKVKDLAAGAVLVFALASLIIGLIIFIPKIF